MVTAPAPFHSYLDAIAHLPPGGTLSFQRVWWDEYEKLLEDLGAGYAARVSYDHGKLEIHRLLLIHEYLKAFLSDLVWVLTDELGVDMQALGSTTFKYSGWQQGLATTLLNKTIARSNRNVAP